MREQNKNNKNLLKHNIIVLIFVFILNGTFKQLKKCLIGVLCYLSIYQLISFNWIWWFSFFVVLINCWYYGFVKIESIDRDGCSFKHAEHLMTFTLHVRICCNFLFCFSFSFFCCCWLLWLHEEQSFRIIQSPISDLTKIKCIFSWFGSVY